MRIPTNEEYDRMVKTTGGEDVKIHWANNYSWVNSAIEHCFHSLHRAVRGYYSASNWVNITTSQYANVGFRPAFGTMEVDTLAPEGHLSIIGTLFMDGQPVEIPQKPNCVGGIAKYIPGARLEIRPPLGDPAYIITGYRVDNAVVADRVLLCKISYEDIEKALKKGTV